MSCGSHLLARAVLKYHIAITITYYTRNVRTRGSASAAHRNTSAAVRRRRDEPERAGSRVAENNSSRSSAAAGRSSRPSLPAPPSAAEARRTARLAGAPEDAGRAGGERDGGVRASRVACCLPLAARAPTPPCSPRGKRRCADTRMTPRACPKKDWAAV